LLGVSFVTSLKTHLCTALTTHNTTDNNSITSRAQNTTELQPNVLLIAIDLLLVTNNERSAFPGANHCQGQLQTPQSVTVHTCGNYRDEASIFKGAKISIVVLKELMLLFSFHRSTIKNNLINSLEMEVNANYRYFIA
jgi:hypothetical protein